MTAWRHALAVAVLPGTVTIGIPAAILWGGGWNVTPVGAAAGAALIAAGLALWVWTVRLFARIGRGTLAPWDPTQRLVVAGPYGHVRNPMISGVLAVLIGEALLFGSTALAAWAAVFAVLNHGYFLVVEEQSNERRFGEEYLRYKENVPRWVPRRTAYELPPRSGEQRSAGSG